MTVRDEGLRRWVESGDTSRLPANRLRRIGAILRALRAATSPLDLDLPGWRLHPLKGDRKGQWSVQVDRTWRIVFRFVDGEARDVDLLDYH